MTENAPLHAALVLFATSFVASAACASARDVWVAPALARSSDGTRAHPYTDLGEAIRHARPGDVVRVRRGVYAGGITIETAGAPGRPVTVRSEDGIGAASIAGGEEGVHFGAGAAWIVFEGFEVRDTNDNVVHIDGGAHDLVLRDLHVHDAGTDGDCVKINQAHDIVVERLDAHAPGRRSDDRDNPWQEIVDALDVTHLVVRDSYLHDGGSVMIYAKGGSRDVLFERNVIAGQREGASDPCLGVGGWTSPEYLHGAEYEATDVVVRDNVIARCTAGGIGVYDAARAWIVHNTLLDVGPAAVRFTAGNAGRSESREIHVTGNLVMSTRGDLERVIYRSAHRTAGLDVHDNAYWNGGRVIAPTNVWNVEGERGALVVNPLFPAPATEPRSPAEWFAAVTPATSSPVRGRAGAVR